jgi:hypothetical protein
MILTHDVFDARCVFFLRHGFMFVREDSDSDEYDAEMLRLIAEKEARMVDRDTRGENVRHVAAICW